jgi:hypothetical protein
MLSLALAAEVGALQLQKQRLHSAVDQSAVVAASGTAQGGAGVGLDSARSEALLRASLIDNLTPLQHDIDGATAADVAATAEIHVITTVPAVDPLDPSQVLRRPTIEVKVHVPVHTGLLQLAHVPGTVSITVTGSADLRVAGGERP